MTIARAWITQQTMDDIRPHPGWDDGRVGFQWCRFDAVIDPEKGIRAEITWDDDSEFEDKDESTRIYFDPELMLEMNEKIVDDLTENESWVHVDCTYVPLERDEVIALCMSDPKELLTKYAKDIAALKTAV